MRIKFQLSWSKKTSKKSLGVKVGASGYGASIAAEYKSGKNKKV